MSDKNNTPASKADQLKTQVDSHVSARSSGNEIWNNIVDTLADAEMQKRERATINAINEYDKLALEFKKINKPDQVMYDENQKEIKSFSSGRMGEIKKKKEDLNKLEDVINKAFSGDFSKIMERFGSKN